MMDFIFYVLFYGSIIAGLIAILVLIAVGFIRYVL